MGWRRPRGPDRSGGSSRPRRGYDVPIQPEPGPHRCNGRISAGLLDQPYRLLGDTSASRVRITRYYPRLPTSHPTAMPGHDGLAIQSELPDGAYEPIFVGIAQNRQPAVDEGDERWLHDSVSFVSLPRSFGSPPLGGFRKARPPLTILSEFPSSLLYAPNKQRHLQWRYSLPSLRIVLDIPTPRSCFSKENRSYTCSVNSGMSAFS